MADENNTGGVDVQVGSRGTVSGDFVSPGAGGDGKPSVKQSPADGGSVTFEHDGSVTREGGAAPVAGEPGAPEEGASGEPGKTPEGGEQPPEGKKPDEAATEGELEALPDWDPENEEVAAKWDERMFPGDGTKLDTSHFAQELEANMAEEGGKPELSEQSYAYLEQRLGVGKEHVDQIIAGELALRQANQAKWAEMAGPKPVWDAKVAWGSENLPQDQKVAFNEAMQSGDAIRIQDQIDLLDARMKRAGVDLEAFATEHGGEAGNTSQSPGSGAVEASQAPVRRGPAPRTRRPSSPSNPAVATTAIVGGAEDSFKDNTEYLAALKDAGKDVQKLREVGAKLRRSKFWKGM